jgi:hypothetical protein
MYKKFPGDGIKWNMAEIIGKIDESNMLLLTPKGIQDDI